VKSANWPNFSRTRASGTVAVRVNPDFELKGSGMKMGGGPKQFGVDAELVPELLAEIGASLQFEGFHLVCRFAEPARRIDLRGAAEILRTGLATCSHAPSPVRFLNLGGGFGIPYFPVSSVSTWRRSAKT
jgi:diaminopimelate decarboxylase